MVLDEFEKYKDYYLAYAEKINTPENRRKIRKARDEMHAIKGEDKFLFTPRFLSMDLVGDHIKKCENTIAVINTILRESREEEKTPLRDILPRKRQYNIPHSKLYEKVIELVDPRFPSIMESRIDGSIQEDGDVAAYEVNANRAGWENSRAFCDIYNRYFGSLLPGYTIDLADGWEDIIKYVLRKIHGKKVIYLTDQRGKESVAALRERGIDINFVRYQNMKRLISKGELSITKDDVTYKGDRVDLICRFLRTHQVLEYPALCDCARNGNIHLINQMDAFYGGLKTLLIKLQDPKIVESYTTKDIVTIPNSAFLRDMSLEELLAEKDRFVLKFGNRGGGKAVYFGRDKPDREWKRLMVNSLKKYPETAMIQEFTSASLTPSLEKKKSVPPQKTTCDVFVFTKSKPKFGGIFSRWSYDNLVNFKTGGIKQTVFVD